MENEFNRKAVKEATKQLLIVMAQDFYRSGLLETLGRVGGYWNELIEGENYTNQEINEQFNISFDVGYSNVVIKEVKNVYSHCEHNLALVFNGIK